MLVDDLKESNVDDGDDEEIYLSINENEDINTTEKVEKYYNYFKKALLNGISKKQVKSFRALLDIDEHRKEPIGLKSLYFAYCENGNRTWLSPTKGIGAIESALRRYNGSQMVLKPIIDLLVQLAISGISPAAFLRFVIIPRLQTDLNWRKWEKEQYPIFQRIGDVLIEIRQSQNFSNEIIKCGYHSLARDILIPKYIGKPLSRLEKKMIQSESFLNEYKEAWVKVDFQNLLFFSFLKRNVLPFLLHFSHKFDSIRILSIVNELPSLSTEFSLNYSDEIYEWKNLPQINLYPVNFFHGIEDRELLGFKFIDYHIELTQFMIALKGFIKTKAGIFLAEKYTRFVLIKKDPKFSMQMTKLINLLPDHGGVFCYQWHLGKFLSLRTEEAVTFLKEVEENGHWHPDYIEPSFTFDSFDIDQFNDSSIDQLSKLAEQLDLSEEWFPFIKKGGSSGDLLNLFYKKYPKHKKRLKVLKDEILIGKDRLWTIDKPKYFDELSPSFYKLFLRNLIPGYYTYLNRNEGFAKEFTDYSKTSSQFNLKQSISFQWQDHKLKKSNKNEEEIIRKSINIQMIQYILASLDWDSEDDTSQFLPILGNALNQLSKVLQDKKNELLTENGSNEKLNVEKSISAMEKKIFQLNSVMQSFLSWSLEKKIVFIIFYASKEAKPGDRLYHLTMNLIFTNLKLESQFEQERQFIIGDIIPENLQLKQLDYLIAFGLGVVDAIRKSESICNSFSNDDQNFIEILTPFSSLNKQSVSLGALEAALKKFFQIGKLISEKSKWIELIRTKSDKPNHKTFRIFSSKSFLDSNFGHMGGLCIADRKKEILRPNLWNFRIVEEEDRKIKGAILMTYTNRKYSGLSKSGYFSAFAINPKMSLTLQWSRYEKIRFYMMIRYLFEKITKATGKPVLLAGIETHGLLSEGSDFAEIIISVERSFKSRRVSDAFSLTDFHYVPSCFAKAYVAVDPNDPDSFHAHSLLGK